MKQFVCKPFIHMFSTCSAFLSEFNVCEDDIIVSNAYIFRPAFEHLGCRAQTLFLEDYGQGEPSDIMVSLRPTPLASFMVFRKFSK